MIVIEPDWFPELQEEIDRGFIMGAALVIRSNVDCHLVEAYARAVELVKEKELSCLSSAFRYDRRNGKDLV